MKSLADLLKPQEDTSGSEDEAPKCGISKMGPANIAKPKSIQSKVGAVQVQSRCIWSEEEIPEVIYPVEEDDPREHPDYKIRYKQQVAAEDVFLGLSAKTPSTADCEDLVVELYLPGESRDDINVEVTKGTLELRSVRYRLSLPLPRPVDPNSSRAVWLADQCQLQISLRVFQPLESVLI